jgi:hypothetical protein
MALAMTLKQKTDYEAILPDSRACRYFDGYVPFQPEINDDLLCQDSKYSWDAKK